MYAVVSGYRLSISLAKEVAERWLLVNPKNHRHTSISLKFASRVATIDAYLMFDKTTPENIAKLLDSHLQNVISNYYGEAVTFDKLSTILTE